MGCNCKRSNEIAQALGETPVNETFGERMTRYGVKLLLAIFTLVATFILVPITMIYIAISMIFTGTATIRVPAQLLKDYKERHRYGEELQNTYEYQ